MDPRHTDIQMRSEVRAKLREVPPELSCPMCGVSDITTTPTLHAFDYGSGDSAVELHVRVPVHRCEACEFEYLDDAAEHLKHAAVCDHLGVLPPSEIRRIRENHGMTRASFAHVTGLGEASLNRWENGLSIQTHANDRYLRLLARPEVLWRLQELMAPRFPERSVEVSSGDRFRALEVTDVLLQEQAVFRLRRAA